MCGIKKFLVSAWRCRCLCQMALNQTNASQIGYGWRKIVSKKTLMLQLVSEHGWKREWMMIIAGISLFSIIVSEWLSHWFIDCYWLVAVKCCQKITTDCELEKLYYEIANCKMYVYPSAVVNLSLSMNVDIQMAVDASDAKTDGLQRENEALRGQVMVTISWLW